jgi:hypothetical protein
MMLALGLWLGLERAALTPGHHRNFRLVGRRLCMASERIPSFYTVCRTPTLGQATIRSPRGCNPGKRLSSYAGIRVSVNKTERVGGSYRRRSRTAVAVRAYSRHARGDW